ncbi:tRNA (adenosine(37)-N6)-threonylcarbamoyltransferase complex ATPase subunit type 1 TsaE [Hydrogeniiclostridium mannosilyticum]|uniref:tRNA (adenosine(37)-N6)-threonylcarbamoyltransferase complex ATPase subunit type 1 TsaE n=1 Tax=Hydrogeniiclostridium mannosilyticum TaxID=2764322 RepID=UPI0018AB2964|nr:tRNA (adenosine(37)-N6)-threonylcarbamoyltransferase complex ATPase subunit type 1 TsaE [Hydrogeniiclostridium mannosilyticum]MBS6163165.1 tRNA (adenosine(37)-N6)-threonylcarbamoyltransferase complex ATPase subunit type 1 TsaE [Clostridiales bacterium]
MKMTTTSPRETELLGERLAQQLKGGEVLALFGGMGMGKTAFTRGLAHGLDVQEPVSSPTFALVNEYAGRLPLYHFDMYRVTSWDDLYSTGFFDYLETGGVLVIEWSENIEEALPENTVKIIFKRGNGENDREIEIEGLEL